MKTFIIYNDTKIKIALKKINSNKNNFLAVLDKNNQKMIGTLTEGDIRRYLINKGSILDYVDKCFNKKFTYSFINSSYESLLKLFDEKIKYLPILDKKMKLVEILDKNKLLFKKNKSFSYNARSPVRVSFAGGGSDITSFFKNDYGAVINTTLCLYSHATLKLRKDNQIILNSIDLKKKIELSLKDLFKIKAPSKFDLIFNTIKSVNPNLGFELTLWTDFPMNSGLGGSSALVSSILGCFNSAFQKNWSKREIAELCFMIERIKTGITGGWQDQYSTVFGGFNFIEFKEKNTVNSLRINRDTIFNLEQNLCLCYTNISHNSSKILKDQISNLSKEKIKSYIKQNAENAVKMKNCLIDFDDKNFHNLLNNSWTIKQKLSKKISSAKLDNIYIEALRNGAKSGKLLGAGGGGFFLFYLDKSKRIIFDKFLKKNNLIQIQINFEDTGLVEWKTEITHD